MYRLRVILVSLGLTLAVSLAGGMLYEVIGKRLDQRRFPQVGQSFQVTGATLNLNCTGTGEPAVILESAVGSPGYSWFDVQVRLADLAQVCWYDRAGYGWSSGATTPRDAGTIASDLRSLLAAAKVPPPYVLVGNGSGMTFVEAYRTRYPAEVSAVLHVVPPQRLRPLVRTTAQRLIPAAINVGLVRAMHQFAGFSAAPEGVSGYDRDLFDFLLLDTKFFRAALSETEAFTGSVNRSNPPGRPADTVTADPLRDPAKVAAAIREVWLETRRLPQ